MKTLVAAFALALALAAAPAAAKDWKKIRIASEGAYPPWNSTDASGKLTGFDIDLAQELCQRIKAECLFIAQDWDGLIPALQAGKYDAIMAAMSITSERQRKIAFSEPYALEPAAFAAMKGSALISAFKAEGSLDLEEISADEQKSLDSIATALKGKTVGVQVSTIHQTMMEKLMPAVSLRTYDKTDNMALDLIAGRIDAMVIDRSNIEALAKAEGGKDITLFAPNFTRGPLGIGIGVGLRKTETDLKRLFDMAIDEARKDGTVARISQKWFGYDVTVRR